MRYSELIPNYSAESVWILSTYPHNNTTTFVTGSPGNIILIRDGELTRRPMQFLISQDGVFGESSGSSTDTDYYAKDNPVYSSLLNYSRVFNSNSISAYIS